MINISASLIRDYCICPQRACYRINHPELSIDIPEQKVGTLVHEIIEKNLSISEADNRIQQGIIDYDLYGNEKKIKELVDNYYTNFKGMTTDLDKVEYRFTIPVSQYFNVVGKVDRITSDGTIIDWKTSAKAPIKITRDVQFAIYKWAVRKDLNIEPIKMYCIYLYRNKIVPVTIKEEYINYIIKYIVPDIGNRIQGQISRFGLISDYACDYCNFAYDCLQGVYGEQCHGL